MKFKIFYKTCVWPDRPSELTLNIEEGQVHQIGESLSVTCALGTRQHWNKFSLTLQCGDLSGTRTENNNNLEISPLTVNHNDVECNCFASWRADQLLYSATRTGTLKVKCMYLVLIIIILISIIIIIL